MPKIFWRRLDKWVLQDSRWLRREGWQLWCGRLGCNPLAHGQQVLAAHVEPADSNMQTCRKVSSNQVVHLTQGVFEEDGGKWAEGYGKGPTPVRQVGGENRGPLLSIHNCDWSIFPPKLIWLQHPFLQKPIIFRESSKILIEVMMDGPIKHF